MLGETITVDCCGLSIFCFQRIPISNKSQGKMIIRLDLWAMELMMLVTSLCKNQPIEKSSQLVGFFLTQLFITCYSP